MHTVSARVILALAGHAAVTHRPACAFAMAMSGSGLVSLAEKPNDRRVAMPSIYRFMWFTVAVILVMFSGAIMAAQKPAILMMAEGDDHGTHLVTEDGISVYLFMADEPHSGQSACQDQCLVFWHPVWTNEEPQAEDGVHKDEISSIRRSAGSFQETYMGCPL